MMGQFEQLDQMLTAQEGMLRTSQVVSSGISKPVFYDYVRSRDLDRVAHGMRNCWKKRKRPMPSTNGTKLRLIKRLLYYSKIV